MRLTYISPKNHSIYNSENVVIRRVFDHIRLDFNACDINRKYQMSLLQNESGNIPMKTEANQTKIQKKSQSRFECKLQSWCPLGSHCNPLNLLTQAIFLRSTSFNMMHTSI